jgi:hypothetical protein
MTNAATSLTVRIEPAALVCEKPAEVPSVVIEYDLLLMLNPQGLCYRELLLLSKKGLPDVRDADRTA